MDDRGVRTYLGHHNGSNLSKTRSSSRLEHTAKGSWQTGQHWPFAHLAETFNGLYPSKSNVLMQDVKLGTHLESEQDMIENGSLDDVKLSTLRNATSPWDSSDRTHGINQQPQPSNELDLPQCNKFSQVKKGLVSMGHKKGFDRMAVSELAKGVYALSDFLTAPVVDEDEITDKKFTSLGVIPSTQQQSMRVNLSKSVLPSGVSKPSPVGIETIDKVSKLSDHIAPQQEIMWEYELSSQPVPDLVSGRASGMLSISQVEFCLPARAGSSVLIIPSSSRLKLRKLPLQVSEKYVTQSGNTAKFQTAKAVKLQKTDKKKSHMEKFQIIKQLLCGGFAGVVSRTAVAPLDLIKTYLITSHGLKTPKSALTIYKEILDQGGWQGLFRGNLVNCIRVAPSKAIELFIFENVRRAFNKEGHPLRNVAATVAGGAAGMAGTVATYPLELLRTRLSVQPELYSGLLQAVTKIYQDEGFMAFYSGLTPSLVGVFPYAATNYFVYDGLRTMYCRSTGRQNVPTIPTLVFGAVAAAASSSVTYPLEVARRQMQLSLSGPVVQRSTVGVILDIYKHEGFLALYRGLGTTWLKLIPAAGISFVCYEAARLALKIDDASMEKPEEGSPSAEHEDKS